MLSNDSPRSCFFVLQCVCTVLLVLTSSAAVFSQQNPRKIAFTHGGSAFASHIAVINEDGTGFKELTDGNRDVAPAWSPDGSQIVYSGERIGGHNIIRMNADGTGQVPLTSSIFPEGNRQGSGVDARWTAHHVLQSPRRQQRHLGSQRERHESAPHRWWTAG